MLCLINILYMLSLCPLDPNLYYQGFELILQAANSNFFSSLFYFVYIKIIAVILKYWLVSNFKNWGIVSFSNNGNEIKPTRGNGVWHIPILHYCQATKLQIHIVHWKKVGTFYVQNTRNLFSSLWCWHKPQLAAKKENDSL